MKNLLIILLLLSSCSPFRSMRVKTFPYTTGGKTNILPLLVPNKFSKAENVRDSSGNEAMVYTYPDGAFLYFANGDTLKEYQPINEAMNVRLPHPAGGWMYKGMDSSKRLFWREVKQGNLRFGYRNVTPDLEIKFDSSLNYASYPKLRRRSMRERLPQ
ncbi:MAG TPA: hypothetical protein VM935_13780 [Chitinophagaceae bacterium]|nr:hypothetical protein [Chitinophagaceae bacterium]